MVVQKKGCACMPQHQQEVIIAKHNSALTEKATGNQTARHTPSVHIVMLRLASAASAAQLSRNTNADLATRVIADTNSLQIHTAGVGGSNGEEYGDTAERNFCCSVCTRCRESTSIPVISRNSSRENRGERAVRSNASFVDSIVSPRWTQQRQTPSL